MSSSSPTTSVSLPLNGKKASPVLPTPSNSTSVRTLASSSNSKHQQLVALEHQLAEKEKQLQESSGGIEKNVLVRQIRQLQDKIQQFQRQPSSLSAPDTSTSTNSLTSTTSSTTEQDQLAPETMEKLRYLERDLNSYRTSLVPGVSRKEKLFNQRSNALNPLPSPSSSSMQESSSASLLPLPPSLAGATPTKRRSKVPNNDRRNTDIEFATEIGQGLLLEVRKMQTLLQEKEEQLRALQMQKADLERAAEALTKQLRQKDETEERLKEETWNLELAKQELTMTVTELQQHLSKANAEQNKLHRQLATVTNELEQVRGREDKLTAAIETLKTRHEQEMASVRRHMVVIQREKVDQAKQLEVLSSELAIAKAQTRIAKKSHQDLVGDSNQAAIDKQHSDLDDDPLKQQLQQQQQGQPGQQQQQQSLLSLSPSTSSLTSSARQQQQQLEVETLKTSLGHAHRMVSTLRSNLHKEKTEKFELKKLLAESQETIEQLQNDPRMWEDANVIPDSSASHHHNHQQVDTTPSSSTTRRPRRSRRRSHARMTSATSRSNSTHLKDGYDDHNHDRDGNGDADNSKSRPTRVAFNNDGESDDDVDDDDSYASFSDDDDENDDEQNDPHANITNSTPPTANTGFTSLSMELSRSQQQQQQDKKPSAGGMMTSLSQELAKHLHPQPSVSTSSSGSSSSKKVHRSLGDELTIADAFRQADNSDDQQLKQQQEKEQQELLKSDAVQDLLKGAAFGAAGTGLVGAIAEARANRGVDVMIQTDDVAVPLPVETKECNTQTDEVIVSLPVESKECNIQTDDVVVSLPVEAKECNIQTDDVVVSLPVEAKERNIQTDDVVVSLPVEAKEITIQTDQVIVSLPVETKDSNIQTNDVIVSLPVESKESNIQTDEVIVSFPVEAKECVVQTDRVVVSLPVEAKEILVQTNPPPTSVDIHVQSVAAEINDNATQTIDIKGVDQTVQATVTMQDQQTQYTAPSVMHQSTQSDQIVPVHTGIQPDPIALEHKAIQTILDHNDSNVTVMANLEKSIPATTTSPSSSSTFATLLASGAAALGIGALAQKDITAATTTRDLGKNDVDDNNHNDGSLSLSPSSPVPVEEQSRISALDTNDKDSIENEAGLLQEKVPIVNSDTDQDRVKLNKNSESESRADDSMDVIVTKACSQVLEDVKELETISRSQAQAMVASAVAAALKEYEGKQPNKHSNDPPSSAAVAGAAAASTTLSPVLESSTDKRHTCDMSANSNTVDGDDLSRSLGLDETTRDSIESKRSLSTEATTMSSMASHHPPERPTSPPPPALLARTRSTLLLNRKDKGKWPMQQQYEKHEEQQQLQQHMDPSSPLPTMARVNPNYYHYAKDGNGDDAATTTASTFSTLPLQNRSASTLAEPNSIALITDTMMGHWLWKSPRHQSLLPLSQSHHQRYFWMHPYTRTLYWSTHAPGATASKDVKTKSAFIKGMKVVPNNNDTASTGLPSASIQVSTSEGDMKLTAPDMKTHQTWMESLSYVLSRQPEADGTYRMRKPKLNHSMMEKRNSSRQSILHDVFQKRNNSKLRHSVHDFSSHLHENDDFHHHHHQHHGNDDDDEVEKLEDLRMCCNGKHHLSHLERDRILPSRPRYPKRALRHSVATGY